ncbi:TetR/AcrR family transcriptional regulator [Streptomyces fuscichromogenes]|uniref:TetR/AcrR family transcriptional regulator n=1 Tax=Streptomyces fuscichromogenes TaxID=1324013 RepID=UPI003830E0F3
MTTDADADAPVRRRRRGPELEAALLDAAWEELTDVGFGRLTMESVAARARTGTAVLYRRWANKDELVLAALRHHQRTHPVDLPDSGSLRGDLLAILTAMGEARAGFFSVAAAAAASGLLTSTGLTVAQVRDRILGDQASSRVRHLYERAHDRGEIDLGLIPPAVLAMPFDLVRHDLLIGFGPVRQSRIQSVVDDLFLPLVRAHSRTSGPPHSGRSESGSTRSAPAPSSPA